VYQSTDVSSEGNTIALIVRLVVPWGTATRFPMVKLSRSCCVVVSTNTRSVIAITYVGESLGLELGARLAGWGVGWELGLVVGPELGERDGSGVGRGLGRGVAWGLGAGLGNRLEPGLGRGEV
jgi:hypothetical protein